ncbi:MAG: hypothetical protein COB04_01105 [Gammaproteobacteria bacterium]|nr:MAG: hypothetical protein COB04_01105 [Gammaproteobacteria bacterium]
MEDVNVNNDDVCALLVTYSDRADFVVKVVKELRCQGVDNIVVVDNGSLHRSKKLLASLVERCGIVVLTETTNSGSAGGFYRGLSYIKSQMPCKRILLLDDDNCPAPGVVMALNEKLSDAEHKLQSRLVAIASLRKSRQYLNLLARGWKKEQVMPPRSSIYGFDFIQKINKFFKKSDPPFLESGSHCVELPYAPYGGLFLSLSLLNAIGLPRTDFYLYGDDTEYTSRIARVGGQIFLAPECEVRDLEPSWNEGEGAVFEMLLAEVEHERVYYGVRNRVYFDSHFYRAGQFRYRLNRAMFVVLLFLFSVKGLRFRRFLYIISALRDGEAGALGKL